MRGRFRSEHTEPEWCSRRIAEVARRRALAALRKQIEAVDFTVYAELVQRWQHVDPRDSLKGADGVAAAIQQLYGVSRPAKSWERDYLRARIAGYDASWLSQILAAGDAVWVGESNIDSAAEQTTLSRLRFFGRGTGALWIGNDTPDGIVARLSSDAKAAMEIIRAKGPHSRRISKPSPDSPRWP